MRAPGPKERLLLFSFALASAIGACAGAGRQPDVANPDDSAAASGDRRSGSDQTGAVTVIREDELAAMRGARIEEVIASRVPGLEVVTIPGGFIFRMRGPSSFLGNGEALCVLDGVPIRSGGISAALGPLQPRDLARVEVLRDAAASSYGPHGANGVILITTRRRESQGA